MIATAICAVSSVTAAAGLLPPHQSKMVASTATSSNDNSMVAIGDGTRKGLSECRVQFRRDRWNCTQSFPGQPHFMNSVRSSPSSISNFRINRITNQSQSHDHLFPAATLEQSNKEIAFLYAITSAGVVHSVTEACSAGNLTDCSCDRSRLGHASTTEGWKWGGCSDNVRYGMMFAKHFVDQRDRQARESAKSPPELLRSLMNLHNSEAGRLAVANQMDLKCRCHGISGSCELKTCWRTLPSFHQVGSFLRKKYDSAVQISERQMRRKLRKRGKVKRKVIVSVPKEDLVYINRSPNYCVEDKSKGILGTTGRSCNKSSEGPDSCSLLCCGRGYNTSDREDHHQV